jgi:hypothetical protein
MDRLRAKHIGWSVTQLFLEQVVQRDENRSELVRQPPHDCPILA